MAAPEPTDPATITPNQRRTPTILVVEDEAIVAADVRASLEAAGYRISSVEATGDGALASVTRERPDLVLLDVMLAGGDSGIDLAATIHTRDDVPVVYLTAFSDAAVVERAKQTAPYGFLLKPFNERELHATVEMALYRHHLEEAMRRHEAQFRQLFDHAPLPYHSLAANGKILVVNQAWLDALGYRRDEVLGRPLADFVVTADLPILQDRFPRFKKEERVYDVEFHLRQRNGGVIAITLNGVIAKDVEGRFNRTHCIFQDVSERRRREAAAVRQRNLESLGLLGGGIAHDFNNLLTSILGNVELAESLVANDPSQARACLVEAKKIALGARSLTGELLTFSNGGAPVKRTGSLAPLLREASTFVVAGGNLACDLQIDPALWPADFDTEQINQVLFNLLTNAVEAMECGGTITLGAANVTVEATSSLPLGGGPYVRITVADQGPGIAPDRLAKIFDPYYTDKGLGEAHGAGLGLAVCHSVVTRHGGAIDVQSELGVGTTFHLYLPAANLHGCAAGATPTARRAATPAIAHGRILVMDDEQMIRDITHQMLTRAGHTVEVVADGREAIAQVQRARSAGAPFDLVILDLSICGGMGGKETIRRLREIEPQLTALVMSGYSNDPIMADYERHGFAGALIKPFAMDTLRAAVESLLHGER